MYKLRGAVEMLKLTSDGNGPKSFNDFTKISIRRRRLSSATVSKRLGELLASGTIKEVITQSKAGRKIISYTTTEKGKKVVEQTKKLDALLASSKGK